MIGNDHRRPRVLMISARADIGGGPEHIWQLLQGLQGRLELYAACPPEPPYWDRYARLLGPERLLPIPKRRLTLQALIALRRFAARHRIDIVHSHGHGAGLYGRALVPLLPLRCVHTHHGLHFVERRREPLGPLKLWLQRQLERLTDASVFVSHDERCSAEAAGLARGRCHVICNGIVPASTSLCLPAPRPTLRQPRLQVVNVNRFNAQKNPEGLLACLHQLRRAAAHAGLPLPEVHVFGDGDGRPAFERAVREQGLGDLVRLHGNVDDLPQRFGAFDVLLSCSRWEGLPLSVLEAMAQGVPVVLSRVVGHREILGHAGLDAFAFESGDAAGAANQLLRFADAEQRERVSCTVAAVVREVFAAGVMLDATEACYRALLQARLPAPVERDAAVPA